jgi:hypothetical protein
MEKLNAIILFIGGVFKAGKTSLSYKLSNAVGVRTLSCVGDQIIPQIKGKKVQMIPQSQILTH